jgi:cell division protein ZapD
MQNSVVYEQPLNEKMRTLLRLEFLFQQGRHYAVGESAWDSRAAISTLLDIQGILMGRTDLKGDLIKEMDRQILSLRRLTQSEGVDQDRLADLLARLARLSEHLRRSTGPIGGNLRENDFLSAIRQRCSIPGGSCGFDLPIYHNWLQREPGRRIADLGQWLNGFGPVQEAIDTLLYLVRNSGHPRIEVVSGGFLQQNIPPHLSCQMVRIGVPQENDCFPEISGGRLRFAVRLLRGGGVNGRSTPLQEPVEIEVTLCTL